MVAGNSLAFILLSLSFLAINSESLLKALIQQQIQQMLPLQVQVK